MMPIHRELVSTTRCGVLRAAVVAILAGLAAAACSAPEAPTAGNAAIDEAVVETANADTELSPPLPGFAANDTMIESTNFSGADTGTIGGDGSDIRLSALVASDIESATLPGELACSFASADRATLLLAKGDVASRDPARGIVKIGSSVEMVAAPGGFDGMTKGATFSGKGTTIRIGSLGTPVGGGESPARSATLTFDRADGAKRSIPGHWTCGP